LNNHLGEIAALATAVCWAFTSTSFTIAGKLVGSSVVNRTRLVWAVLFLSVTHLLLQGELLPIHAEPSRWWWLGLSGIVGLTLGDSCLFQAFVLIGTHLSMVLLALVPVFGTLIAWIFLNETLSPIEIGAIALTVSGIILVVLKKRDSKTAINRRQYTVGILYGIGGALGQALGLVIAKKGLGGDFPGLSATLIRVLIATVAIWLFTLVRGQAKYTLHKLSSKKANLSIAAGAFGGPFLGIWLSMVAIKWTHIGIASTLMALSPVLLLPVAYRIFKEKISFQSIIGTVVAVVGTAVIFLT
jgi:drug/metabolite transporter (DMT)-like permease